MQSSTEILHFEIILLLIVRVMLWSIFVPVVLLSNVELNIFVLDNERNKIIELDQNSLVQHKNNKEEGLK